MLPVLQGMWFRTQNDYEWQAVEDDDCVRMMTAVHIQCAWQQDETRMRTEHIGKLRK
jgi:hypothetical protein